MSCSESRKWAGAIQDGPIVIRQSTMVKQQRTTISDTFLCVTGTGYTSAYASSVILQIPNPIPFFSKYGTPSVQHDKKRRVISAK